MIHHYREAYDATDYVLNNLYGVAEALRELARENRYVGSNDPDAMMLMALIITVSDQLKQVEHLRSAEWEAALDTSVQAA